jgi:hypothetical protein
MDRDTTRDNYEKPRGVVVCDLHVKRDLLMKEAEMKHSKLLRRMNVLTGMNIVVCILSVMSLVLVLMLMSKQIAPMAFGG